MTIKTYCAIGVVTVFDFRGDAFYHYEPRNSKPYYFNINIDRFNIVGDAWLINADLYYLVRLPKKEVEIPPLTIGFSNNGEPASLDRGTGVLLIDEAYRNLPLWMVYFLYFHEMGHFIYPSKNGRRPSIEFNCDKYAAKYMLSMGFNPSQILAAMMFILNNSEEANYRYKRMIGFLNSVRTKLYEN